MEKSTKKRVRNVVLGMTSVALVAGITASLTLAYLTDTDTRDNIFTNNPSISAKLVEPGWDGDADGDGVVDTGVVESDLGKTIAGDYTVDSAIPKDPKIFNTSATAEYAAISVEYQVKLTKDGDYTTISKADFDEIATVNFTGSWEKMTTVGNKDYYILGTSGTPVSIAAGAKSADLFTSVTVTTDPAEPVTLTAGTLALSKEYPLPEFQIVLNGAVIDTANESGNTDSVADNLTTLLNGGTIS